MNTVIIALGIFAVVLALLVALRAKTGNRIDIKNSDIVLALVPVALWLFLTGKIQEFAFGEVKIVAAIKVAAKAPVGPQVSKLTLDTVREPVRTMTKGGPEVIPQMINTKSGSFFGIADARQIAQIIRESSPRFNATNLADWLNEGNKTELEALPGFISSAEALHKNDDKQKALERMNSLDAQVLPVLDEAGRFDGIVDRSKLTASILTEIAQHVEKSDR